MSNDAPHQVATENFENPEQYITKTTKISFFFLTPEFH